MSERPGERPGDRPGGPPAGSPEGRPAAPSPGEPGSLAAGPGASPRYPQQALTPQQVQPGRSRRPWLVGAAALVVAGIVAGVGFVLLDGDGEERRDAYCAALTEATNGGDLMGALEGADADTVATLEEAADLAPDVVADEWDTLLSLARDPDALSEQEMLSTGLAVLRSLRSIARDAEQGCGLELDVPF